MPELLFDSEIALIFPIVVEKHKKALIKTDNIFIYLFLPSLIIVMLYKMSLVLV